MPHKGYRQTPAHRRRIMRANQRRAERIKDALAAYGNKPTPTPKKSFTNPAPEAAYTPVPPSASPITSPTLQCWGLYGHNEGGRYYYKLEQADTVKELQQMIYKGDIKYPLWTYVKSATDVKDLFMPIRIPENLTASLGQRFQQLKEKK